MNRYCGAPRWEPSKHRTPVRRTLFPPTRKCSTRSGPSAHPPSNNRHDHPPIASAPRLPPAHLRRALLMPATSPQCPLAPRHLTPPAPRPDKHHHHLRQPCRPRTSITAPPATAAWGLRPGPRPTTANPRHNLPTGAPSTASHRDVRQHQETRGMGPNITRHTGQPRGRRNRRR